MLRLIIQTKRIYKKIEKQESKTNEEIEETDINDLCSIDDESGDGLDWIEYIKRSTQGQDGKRKKLDAGTRLTKK